jgi:hypothetical protein
MQVVLVHRGGVTEPGVLILKLLSITYLARTRHRALREAVQVYVLQVAPQRVRPLLSRRPKLPQSLLTRAEYALIGRELEGIGLRRRIIFFQFYVGIYGVFELGLLTYLRPERGLLKLGKCDQVINHLDLPRQSRFTRQRLRVWSKESIRNSFVFGTREYKL